MKKNFSLLILILQISFCLAQNKKEEYKILLEDIYLSDPFIFADDTNQLYYMYGSGGSGVVYSRASTDLKSWTEPFVVYRFPIEHWAGDKAPSWAAEVHKYNGKFYLFTTSDDGKAIGKNIRGDDYPHRATQLYVSDTPWGPFSDFTNNTPHTPADWPCLDGSFWVEDGIPYMVFCHEWTQIMDGTMDAVRLPENLGVPDEPSFVLFKGSDAPYIEENQPEPRKSYVTDGAFLFKTQTGRLGMIWSSWKDDDYVLIAAYSESGRLEGPWEQDEELLFEDNGGHGMLFRTFEGKLMLSMHYVDSADERPRRKPIFFEMDDSGDKLKIKEGGVVIK